MGPYLRIYLNDHRAGAAGGLALARRCLRNNEASDLGATLRSILDEIKADADTLDGVARYLGVPENRLKLIAARVGELAGRAEGNGHARGYSPVRRLVGVRAPIAAIEGERG